MPANRPGVSYERRESACRVGCVGLIIRSAGACSSPIAEAACRRETSSFLAEQAPQRNGWSKLQHSGPKTAWPASMTEADHVFYRTTEPEKWKMPRRVRSFGRKRKKREERRIRSATFAKLASCNSGRVNPLRARNARASFAAGFPGWSMKRRAASSFQNRPRAIQTNPKP